MEYGGCGGGGGNAVSHTPSSEFSYPIEVSSEEELALLAYKPDAGVCCCGSDYVRELVAERR